MSSVIDAAVIVVNVVGVVDAVGENYLLRLVWSMQTVAQQANVVSQLPAIVVLRRQKYVNKRSKAGLQVHEDENMAIKWREKKQFTT